MRNYKKMIFNTLTNQHNDCIPYIPRMDLWYNSRKYRGTLPRKYKNATLRDITDDLEIGYHSVMPDFMYRDDMLDEVDRGLGIYRLNNLSYRCEISDVKRTINYQGDKTHVEYETPYGNISTTVRYDESMKQAGITISHVEEHAIKSAEDFKSVGYIFDRMIVKPTYQNFRNYSDYVGNRGVVVGFAHCGASPMQMIQRDLMQFDKFIYAMNDYPEEMKELCLKIEKVHDSIIETVINGPADYIMLGCNFDSSLTWPPYFSEHITPFLKRASKKIHAKNKFLMTHPDGDNSGLLDEYVECGFDIADSLVVEPMNRQKLSEVREIFKNKITIWGGIPSVIMLKSGFSDYDFEKYMENFMSELGDGKGFIMGVADTVPPDAEIDRIIKLKKYAEDFGPV